jgi:uncharacterized protein with PIN domain
MLAVTFHFHGALNYFLRPEQRNCPLLCEMAERAAVKHPIESLGIPHPEVEAILVRGQPVDFAHRVSDGDWVEVYPFGEIPSTNYSALRPPVPDPVRFVLDAHLGQLATYLRLLGFDTLYRNDYGDPELAQIAAEERRVLLTRDRGLLKHRIVVHGYCVRETAPREQLVSVLRRFKIAGAGPPWRGCLRCNGLLEDLEKSTILHRLQPKTRLYYEAFQRCAACDRIYWQGSHFDDLARFVEEVLAEAANEG